ncbi:MAG TPA: cytochrome b/b6 domain-containing protein, partial [Sphingomicrobium sp.]|nr:cytochrome b/b6 domain-containing protein [Sphingomicrobium sp.]
LRGPQALADYFRGDWYGIGHSPLGAISVLVLLTAVAIQVGLGLVAQDEDGIYMGPLARLVSSDHSDRARDLHAAWFNVLVGLIVVHLAAIVFYRLRGKSLTVPMITGKAAVHESAAPMRRGRWWVAFLCLLFAIAITRWVIAGAPHFSA